MIEAHLPEGAVFPKTKFLFFKKFSSLFECEQITHLYCPGSDCFAYLTTVPCAAQDVECPQCKLTHSVAKLLQLGSFFLTLDIETQIKALLLSGKIPANRAGLSYDVSDITQSAGYNSLPMTKDDLSVTWNTDGIPLFESSGHSVWPLLLQVNELPYKERVNNLLLSALWFGIKKPKMNTFLRPFTETMNRLSSEGISWAPEGGDTRISRVYPGPCTVDTVARCTVMKMSQFNGAYGCAWCEQKGEKAARGRGHAHVYPMQETAPKLRTHDTIVKHAEKANKIGKAFRGVRGPSILFFMSFLTFPTSFVVDYMHAVCNGFVQSTATLWFKHQKGSRKNKRDYRIGRHITEINNRLKALTPVWEMTRLPRGLNERKFWKASEWRNWLLFFSPVVLLGLLPDKYYDNWIRFVGIMHFCLQGSIPMDRIDDVRKCMVNFLREYEQLYGKQCMTFNAHILLHMVDHIKMWGPPWGFSAFPFESVNGKLVRLVNGTRYAHSQIVEKFCILQSLPQILSMNTKWQSEELRLFVRSLYKGYSLRKVSSQTGSVILFGKGNRESGSISYKKASVGVFTYCVASMDKSRRKNSYVLANGSMYGQVMDIFTSAEQPHREVNFRIKKFHVVDVFLTSAFGCDCPHFVHVQETNECATVRAVDVTKCVFLCCSDKTVLSAVNAAYVLESS